MQLYRKTEPHAGFGIMLKWGQQLQQRKSGGSAKNSSAAMALGADHDRKVSPSDLSNAPATAAAASSQHQLAAAAASSSSAASSPCYMVVTSNVDGAFIKRGFPEHLVREIHGNRCCRCVIACSCCLST